MTNPENNSSRPAFLAYGDGMRALAVLAVVAIHSSSHGVILYGKIPMTGWWVSNLIDSICRWCVPVFIMLSGALLLNPAKKESWFSFYKKRVIRIFIPLIFWSAFYFAWFIYYRGEKLTANDIALRFWHGMTDNHLYFLFLVLGLSAITPFLRSLVKNTQPFQLWIFVFTFFAALEWVLNTHYPAMNALTMFIPYIGYFAAGYLLRGGASPRLTPLLAGIFLLSTAIITIGTGFVYGQSSGRNLGLFYDHFFPAVIAQSVSAFLLIARFFTQAEKNRRGWGWVKILGPSAFGIYLIHLAVLDAVRSVTYHRFNYAVIPVIVFEIAVTYGVSALIVLALRRIPGLRFILG